MNRGRGVAVALVLAVCALAPVGAPAQPPANCQVQVTSDIQFGQYDALATGDLDTTGTVRVTCQPPGVGVLVRINEGSSGTFSQRRMFSGPESLTYNLYVDPIRSTIWGDGSGGTEFVTVPKINPGQPAELTVYARTSLGQDVSPGLYTDTVTIVIEY